MSGDNQGVVCVWWVAQGYGQGARAGLRAMPLRVGGLTVAGSSAPVTAAGECDCEYHCGCDCVWVCVRMHTCMLRERESERVSTKVWVRSIESGEPLLLLGVL